MAGHSCGGAGTTTLAGPSPLAGGAGAPEARAGLRERPRELGRGAVGGACGKVPRVAQSWARTAAGRSSATRNRPTRPPGAPAHGTRKELGARRPGARLTAARRSAARRDARKELGALLGWRLGQPPPGVLEIRNSRSYRNAYIAVRACVGAPPYPPVGGGGGGPPPPPQAPPPPPASPPLTSPPTGPQSSGRPSDGPVPRRVPRRQP